MHDNRSLKSLFHVLIPYESGFLITFRLEYCDKVLLILLLMVLFHMSVFDEWQWQISQEDRILNDDRGLI